MLREAQLLIIFLLAAVVFVAQQVGAAHVVDAYRVLQFSAGGEQFGPQRTSMNLVAGTANHDDLSRRAAVVPAALLAAKPSLLTTLVDERHAEGLLILLPNASLSAGATKINLTGWQEVERALVSRQWKIPIYFSFEDSETNRMATSFESASVLSSPFEDTFSLTVSGTETDKLPNATMYNFQAWLSGSAAELSSNLPTIAVVAYYDAFAAAPALAKGGDGNGSGVVALLEILRLFHKLYSSTRVRAKANLLFLLTSGGRFNFAGSRSWTDSAETEVLDKIDFVLCLDSIGRAGPHLHIYKPPKDPQVQAVYDTFTRTASDLGLTLQTVHKKVNLSSLSWEHEQFASQRLFSFTLSSLTAPAPAFLSSHSLDTESTLSAASLEANIRLAAEFLAARVFDNTGGSHVFEGSLGVDSDFIKAWLDTLTSHSRFAPYLSRTSPLLASLERTLREYSSEVKRVPFKWDLPHTFYGQPSYKLTLYKTKSLTFDLIVLAAVASYLLFLSLCLQGPRAFFANASDLFRSALSRKAQKRKTK
jgi:hypothetical protein